MENGLSERPTTRWRREDSHQNGQSSSTPIRPYTQQSRPASSGRSARPPSARPPSASGTRNAIPPGTASRLTSAMQSQPFNARVSSSLGRPPPTAMSVMERPVTQQGLSGLQSATPRAPPQRQVQDKRYFQGLVQSKIRALNGEMQRLSQELEAHNREQATYLTYDRRAKETAQELTELQGKLADLNLVVDKINTDTEREEVEAETQELHSINERRKAELEHVFEERRTREAQINQLENEIQQERQMADGLVEAMNPTLRQRYSQLQDQNKQLQRGMEQLQAQLDALSARKSNLEEQLSLSQVKQEAVRLHARLSEAVARRDQLVAEENTRASPAQEREALLQRVKEDNAETASMERQLTELRETVRRRQEELDSLDQDLEESQSERHQKYRELRKREETIENFLSTFEDNRTGEIKRIEEYESEIITALQTLSRVVSRTAKGTPDFDTMMQESLLLNQEELDISKQSAESLSSKQAQLRTNLAKVEDLESKVKNEIASLQSRIKTMQEDIPRLQNIEALRKACDEKRKDLLQEKEKLENTHETAQAELKRARERNGTLKKQLSENETHAQLSNLERKLSLLEQNNFAIREFIASKKSETECEPFKTDACKSVKSYNEALKEALKPGQSLVF